MVGPAGLAFGLPWSRDTQTGVIVPALHALGFPPGYACRHAQAASCFVSSAVLPEPGHWQPGHVVDQRCAALRQEVFGTYMRTYETASLLQGFCLTCVTSGDGVTPVFSSTER